MWHLARPLKRPRVPLTFPVHPAVAIPFRRFQTPLVIPAALATGAMMPDAAYMGLPGMSHEWASLLRYNVVFGVLAYVLAELWILPSLRRTLPVVRGLALARWAVTRGLPRSVLGWLAAVVSVTLGVVSHLLWDGFTHATMWPARVLYPHTRVGLFGHAMSLAFFLQNACSLVGTVLVLAWAVRVTPKLAPAPSPPSPDLGLVLGPCLAGLGAGVAWHVHLVAGCNVWLQELWLFGWAGMRGACLGLLLGCGLERTAHLIRASRRLPA